MDNIFNIRLEAHNDGANRHRVYVMTVGCDLFKRWSLRINYGRAGCRLRERQFSGDSNVEVRRLVTQHLRRRLSAPRRIGCPYRLCSLELAPGEDAQAWLPAELLLRFLVSPSSDAIAA